MKKIIISLAIIGVVSAAAIGGTIAYFSDTETNEGNLFKAGTIDIWVEGEGDFTWSNHAEMFDMKPCYTDYINFIIHNDKNDANPVNVYKKLYNLEHNTGVVSEPECTEQGGEWIMPGGTCNWANCGQDPCDKNNIASIIDYDLSVEVYKEGGNKPIWWQTIYAKEVTVGQIKNKGIYLGMIPAGGYMKVTQSYHMQDPDRPTNWAQGDEMSFDIEVKGVQLRGEAWLDEKDANNGWKVITPEDPAGVLTYKVKHPTFEFTFNGKAPLNNTEYCLFIGGTPVEGDWDADIEIGCARSDNEGNIEIIGDEELNQDVKNAKAWLIRSNDYNGSSWSDYHPEQYLWETGLIWYEDTDE